MARHEEEREDLLAEAVALVRRVELICPTIDETVVFGFRANGAACMYVGSEPVFQFNTRHELRRLFADGAMLKAHDGRLVRLRRERTADETLLLARELTDKEMVELVGEAVRYCDLLQESLNAGSCRVGRQVPTDGDLRLAIVEWLQQLPRPPVIADRPNVES